MPYKLLRLLALSVATTAVIIAVGHLVSYLVGCRSHPQ